MVQLAHGERSYHIFYHLCAGASSVLKGCLPSLSMIVFAFSLNYVKRHPKQGFLMNIKFFLVKMLEVSTLTSSADDAVLDFSCELKFEQFYCLLLSIVFSFTDRLNLKTASEYHYLNQSACLAIDGVDDAKKFHKLMVTKMISATTTIYGVTP